MVDRRKVFSLISSLDHYQKSSLLWISKTPRAGFEPAHNLSLNLDEWSRAWVITATPRWIKYNTVYNIIYNKYNKHFYFKKSVKLARFKDVYTVQSPWSKWNICFTTISDLEELCRYYFGWIQWQPFKFFYLAYFCFLRDLIFKQDENIKCKQIPLSFLTPNTDFENSTQL